MIDPVCDGAAATQHGAAAWGLGLHPNGGMASEIREAPWLSEPWHLAQAVDLLGWDEPDRVSESLGRGWPIKGLCIGPLAMTTSVKSRSFLGLSFFIGKQKALNWATWELAFWPRIQQL